jgi:hypothetical protein
MTIKSRTWFERLSDGLTNLLGIHRCQKCGGKMKVAHFHPPIFVKDGVSGIRAKCRACGHVEVLFCRVGL